MRPTRRQFLSWLPAFPLLSSPSFVFSQEPSAQELRVADAIRQYSAQGYHRTGTAVDTVSGAWLSDRIQDLGLPSFMDPITLDRVEILYASFTFNGIEVEGVPLYDCHYSDVHGITGTLGPLGSNADIGVVMLPPSTSSPTHNQLAEVRRSNRHRAIIIVSDSSYPAEGIATLNAEDFNAPVGPPTLQIANAIWPALQQAMTNRAEATVVAFCERKESKAYNVSARIDGTDPDLAPIVIMTPRSGWWRCASERGGGIAVFMELIRALIDNPPTRDVILTANSGHELGHLGLDLMLHENPALAKDAAMWIHLGANFAATSSQVRLQYSNSNVRSLSARHLQRHNLKPDIETAIENRPLGEARNIFDQGGNFLSILGTNPLFHHPDDRWPDAVDIAKTVQWAQALTTIVLELSRE
ncbi:MAG: hypothetical protein ACSHXZ_02325 [Gammaproteobacteria bacterium]